MRNSQFKSAVNVFSGLATDFDPSNKNNSVRYNYAENILIGENANSGSTSNANDFDVLKEIDFEYDLISHESVPGYTIFVFRSGDELLVYKYLKLNNEDVFAKIATIRGDFSGSKHLSIQTSIESDLIERLYIADGVNQIMSLNVSRSGNPSSWNIDYDALDLAINKKYSDSITLMPSIVDGSLPTGKYFYVARYVSDSGSMSNVVGVSNGINLKRNEIDGGYIDNATGNMVTSRSGVRISMSGISSSAYALAVYRVYYKSTAGNPEVNLIYYNKISGGSMHVDDLSREMVLTSQAGPEVFNTQEIVAAVLAKKDNILFAGNIKYPSRISSDSIDYDVRAFAFDKFGLFKYKNLNSNTEITLNSNLNLEAQLSGKDTHDFIAEDIYDSYRYRDVTHRYKANPGSNKNSLIYGGTGVNVDYEFCNAHLIAAGEGNRRSLSNANLYRNLSSDKFSYNNTNLKWINVFRDDLTVRYGDISRYITQMPIKLQGESSLNILDVRQFGISHHNGKFDYSNEILANVFSGYKRNEIYRFACKMTFEDGTSTDPMWISDIRFPANYIKKTRDAIGYPGQLEHVYSFSAFESPEDTFENFYSTLLERPVLYNSRNNTGRMFDVNQTPGSNGIYRSELYVKPLGLKFKFKNLNKLTNRGLSKIEIMYTPMDYYERSIVGQFAVNRIGKFSNTGQYNDTELGVDEGSCIGHSYPHPTMSMKHSYGIGPMVMFSQQFNSNDPDPSLANTFVTRGLGFDGYKEALRCTRINNTGLNSTISHEEANLTSMPITTSPYFADFKNYMLISPEISYIGEEFANIMKSARGLVFENLIFPKSTMPWVKNINLPDIEANKSYLHIPVVGGRTDILSHSLTSSIKNKVIGNSLATIGVPSANSYPSLLYSGAMLSSDNEYDPSIDESYVYLTLCGAIDSAILNGYRITSNSSGNRNVYYERVFSSLPGLGFESNVKPVSDPEIGHLGTSQSSRIIPRTIKTFMSGIGYFSSFPQGLPGPQNAISTSFDWNTGHVSSPTTENESSRDLLSTKESGRFFDRNEPLFNDKYYLNASSFKYFRSSLNSRYNNPLNPNDQTSNTNYVSFIWQNGPSYNDVIFNEPRSTDYSPVYTPTNDHSMSGAVGPLENVWDLPSINITVNSYVGILNEPTGPFDVSQSKGPIRLINYSKTLCHNLTGPRRNHPGSSTSYLISPWHFDSESPIYGSAYSGFSDNPRFTALNLINRGRISGKHGAGVLISVDGDGIRGTIPMVGHINTYSATMKRFRFDTYPGSEMVDSPLHRLDQAVSTHNSTFLVDLRKPSGLKARASYYDKANSRYIYTAQTIGNISSGDTEKDIYVFGGDTYVSLFDYTNTYPTYVSRGASFDTTLPIDESYRSWNTRYYLDQQCKLNSLIPIETFINTHVDAGYTNRKNMNHLDSDKPGMLPVNAGYSSPVVQRPQRDLDEYVYSDAYSSKRKFDELQVSISFDDRYNDPYHKSRIVASEPKVYGETIDSFSIFKPNNFIDLDPSNGPVTSLQTPLNRLYAFQPYSVSYISINERSLISDESGAQLILGAGGVLTYAQKLSSNYGLSEDSMAFARVINDRVYFFDSYLKNICILGDVVKSLSEEAGIQELAKTGVASKTSTVFPLLGNDHAVFSFDSIGGDKKNLIYNIRTGLFESIYTGDISYGFNYDKNNMVIGKKANVNGLAKISDDRFLDPQIGFICNTDFIMSKVFDGVSINLSQSHAKTLTDVSVWHKYDNSIQSTGDFVKIDEKFSNRTGAIVSSIPRSISGEGSTARMRDKYINSMYKFVCNGNEISIPFIRTNFRYSYM